jgi:aminotransferase
MPLSLAPRASRIQQSEIRAMSVACAEAGGINLSQGVCDTEVPAEVRRAAEQAIEDGWNTYSRCEGVEGLRRALAVKMRAHNGLDYDPQREILVTSGATGAFYAAALALLDPGDEVILFEPYYGYHRNTLLSLGARPLLAPLLPPDWSFRVSDLERIATPRTRGIMLNTPANPSGKVFTRAELEALGEFAAQHDLFVFTDEVYEHFVYDGRAHASPAGLPGLRERTIMINALSKTFAVTGWRLGWLAADARWIGAFAAFSDLVYVCAPTPLQLGAQRGLELLGSEYYQGIARDHERKRDLLCAALADAGLAPHVPHGAYYVLADLSRLPGSTGNQRAMHLLEAVGVACVPGEAFFAGPEGARLARFSFGKNDRELAEACRRLRKL